METRVTYTAAASSMDSWDMENLKYLKKISTNNPQGSDNNNSRRPSLDRNRNRSGTYVSSNSSSSDVGEEMFLRDAGTTEVELPNSTILHHVQKAHMQGPDKNMSVGLEEEINNNQISLMAPLDTCYLLDVVTIRNESVLAVRHPKPKLGSDGASSAGSSIGEANFFDDVNESLPEFGRDNRRLNSRAQSRASTNTTLIENDSRRNGFKTPCPYCDNGMVTNNDFFYLGQKGNFEESSMVPTLGGEGPPEMPRTPSPYYVRLRRDLISYTPALRQPRNFGMDKQGQLLIDYSPNWVGLENYVRNLKRC